MLTKDLFDQIVAVLLPEMGDAQVRKALIERALYNCPGLQRIQWDGAAHSFTVHLTRLLDQFGEIAPSRLAIVALLEEVKAQVGADRQKQIDDLMMKLKAPPARQEIQSPPKTFAEGELYLFISYARPDQAVAEKIEAFLTAAGVRVFRDKRDICVGANWDQTIEEALRECQRMLLLLSSSSMPYRKEVHREWFYFDQKRKPIYPLYISDCDLHSRFVAYNYIDARSDLQGALEVILNELGRAFDLPEPMTYADKVSVFESTEAETRSLPEALQSLNDAVRDPEGSVVLSVTQAIAIRDHKPADLKEYRLGRLAEWSLPRFQINKRFVNLTLLLDTGETELQRWQKEENVRFNDLRDVLGKKKDDPVLVLLGAPGSGKSTLLRRLQLDHSIEQLRDDGEQVSFFAQLNGYRAHMKGELPDPGEWLNACWPSFSKRAEINALD